MAMVPCLHQGNIYTKRNLRVWRDQKCIPLVGAINPHTCEGRSNTLSRGRQYRAQNGKLGKLGRTCDHGTVFAPRKYLNQKEATCMERSEMYSAIRCNNPTYLRGQLKYPVSREVVEGPERKVWINRDGPVAMVPCLNQGNIYTKRKLRVWRDHKCIPLVGAITPLTCAGHQNTPSRGRQYRCQNGKSGKLGRTYDHGTVFTPRKYLYQIEATDMERSEMYSASRCNNPTYLCGTSKYPVSREAERKVG